MPPFVGAAQLTLALLLAAVAVGLAGAEGTVAGTIAVEGGEGLLVPSALVAVTVKV